MQRTCGLSWSKWYVQLRWKRYGFAWCYGFPGGHAGSFVHMDVSKLVAVLCLHSWVLLPKLCLESLLLLPGLQLIGKMRDYMVHLSGSHNRGVKCAVSYSQMGPSMHV